MGLQRKYFRYLYCKLSSVVPVSSAVDIQQIWSTHELLYMKILSVRPRETMSEVEMAKTNSALQNGTSPKNVLHVIDQRTGKYYQLPISHNAVNATEFQQIKAPENHEYYADQDEHGVRIFDPGFSNTAVSTSNITYVWVLSIFSPKSPKLNRIGRLIVSCFHSKRRT